MEDFKLIWYNALDMMHSFRGSHEKLFRDRPGFIPFKNTIQFFQLNVSLVDRTHTISLPIKTKVLPFLEMPEYKKVNYNFSELCEIRARQLLDHAISSERKLALMYSGGIDSTLILISLFKVASLKEIKEHIVVLLNHNSIGENRKLYYNEIVKKCNIESSYDFTFFLGNDKYIFITGETGDQLFGSAVIRGIINKYGKEYIHKESNYENIFRLFKDNVYPGQIKLNDKDVDKIVHPFNNLINAAPIKIDTVYHYFWWINFTMKWQSVYARTIGYTKKQNRKTLKPEDNYFAFFSTPEMQLWSMNNPDKLIKDDWKSYKYIAKDIIYDYDKNDEYFKDKIKLGSLRDTVVSRKICKTIDENFNFYDNTFPENIWNNNNDFI